MKQFYLLLSFLALSFFSCKTGQSAGGTGNKAPFVWENANLYFLLTDRFNNGNPANDLNFGRTGKTAKLRGFMGGDIKGITKKIEEGYFDRLGVTAIWFTPVVEQVHGGVDEGTGFTYGFHGYWTKDWTRLDPNFGTEQDLAELVDKSPETIKIHLKEARKRELLTTVKGRAGGHLTSKARQILQIGKPIR